MNENSHLPVFGVGPYLIFSIIAITISAIALTYYNIMPTIQSNQIILTVIGVILIAAGALFWLSAVKNSEIDKNIKQNKLVTSGIYGIVRHPIYAAFLYAVTGLIFIANNLILLVLPVLYWLILTVVMKNTEEKWLSELYGDDYLNYSKKVNRFIPKVL